MAESTTVGNNADEAVTEALDTADNKNEVEENINEEMPIDDSELQKDLEAEPRASPTARPQSRGSISTAKKV